MAKYCANCGKALPDGVELCPDCGGTATEDGAALFTRMTAETEGWKTAEEKPKKERPKPTRSQKQLMAYIAAAVVVVALAVCFILYIQPAHRVVRAIGAGNYDQALELYWGNTRLATGEQDDTILRAAKRAAGTVVEQFGRHELTADEAASALGKLGALGETAEALLNDEIEAFRALNLSQEHMDKAEELSRNGEFLAAREEYLLVLPEDSAYAEAQEQARESLNRYADSVLSEADVFIQSRDYVSALQTLKNGERVLLSFDVYHEQLDYKLSATYELYEKDALERASAKAGEQNYSGAAQILRTAMERFDYTTDAMTEAEARYLELAQDKEVDDAAAQANELFDQGRHAEAFDLLEEKRNDPDVQAEELDAAIAALEKRYTDFIVAEANTRFAGRRDNLPEIVAELKKALRTRETPGIQACLEELSAWLPVSLAEMEYVDKQGTIFRSTSPFEGLDGTSYEKGWVWGENEAELTFILNGVYDQLRGTLAVRRDDDVKAGGSFTVICDGQEVYSSETLEHPTEETIPISVDISGCQRLTLRFTNDYSVRTADNGYCYHGFCGPTITKYLEGEVTAPPVSDSETETAAPETGEAAPAEGE